MGLSHWQLFWLALLTHKPSTKSPKLEENMAGSKILFMKQEVKTLDHGNLEMMKVVKEYERAISEVIADRERERVCHVSFRQEFSKNLLKIRNQNKHNG